MSLIRFHIRYATRWGESLCLDYSTESGRSGSLPLHTPDGLSWTAQLEVPASDGAVGYSYRVCLPDGSTARAEQTFTRRFDARQRSRVLVCDRWTERDVPQVLLRSAFTECVFRRQGGASARMELLASAHLLLMRAVVPPEGFRWGVLGSTPALGGWDPSRVKFLQRTDVYEWGLALTPAELDGTAEYKYVLVDASDKRRLVWEAGDNRRIGPRPAPEDGTTARNEAFVQIDDAPRVELEPWRGAGVVVPVFSLRSRESFGVGDFGDLRQFITWAAQSGLSAIQLLPINDTTSSGTWRDSYPYSGISVFALHPIYLDPREWRESAAYRHHAERGSKLNRLPELDYEAVFAEKMAFLTELYGEIGRATLKTKGYKAFVHDNRAWLEPYAGFCRRKAEACGRPVPAAGFHCFVQYLLHRQMTEAHDYARSLGIILKGDIPIGICRDSVPAEVDTRLFHFDGQAGAPPDDFAVRGQNWGFPTYDWEEMAKDGYGWWRRRFAAMNNYFDAYRIDHVLGFFRIWEIPTTQVYGVLGRFRPALPLSEEEIRAFGFKADINRFARPWLTAARLGELEESVGGHGLRRFFDENPDGTFALKTEFGTQRKILERVGEGRRRDLLLDVAAEVLFIEDPEKPGHYHPRICGRLTAVYNRLDEADRRAFDRLHDDFFYFRHDRFWADEAMKKLPAIIGGASDGPAMLPCAEDLGMVPACVPGVLERLGVLSLEIQRMPKQYGVRFGDLGRNPYMSVSTIATHDMPPLRLWWREDAQRTQAFWNDVLHREGKAAPEATADVCEEVVAMHLNSPSMLCLIALQDLLGMDEALRHPQPEREQINDPANADQYWRYRMHLTIEELAAATSFNEKLRGLVACSGRIYS